MVYIKEAYWFSYTFATRKCIFFFARSCCIKLSGFKKQRWKSSRLNFMLVLAFHLSIVTAVFIFKKNYYAHWLLSSFQTTKTMHTSTTLPAAFVTGHVRP